MNRLASEPSLYLRQHAHNPVAWQPWGDAAWAEARQRNVPVLISIGYSSCHWCHVMEREVFEKPALAEPMNAAFVCIKVDREERPDVDMIYMEAVQRMGLGGGWPLNVFCTPEGEPFYGGTYFPPANWAQVVREISRAWREHEGQLRETGVLLRKAVADEIPASQPAPDTYRPFLEKGLEALLKQADWTWGGVGGAPKFPTPSLYRLLLHAKLVNEDGPRLAHLTLENMARRGLYDQLGGGFFRYSTDAQWFAPHFEKMLYDNGQLLSLFSEAFRLQPNPIYKRVVDETVDWLEREMTSPDGAFYSSIDADSEGEEGRFYTWPTKELKQVLGEGFPDFAKIFEISEGGNWEHGRNILAFERKRTEGLSDQLRTELFHIREKRVKPVRDGKVIACWNALACLGLVDAYRFTGNEKALGLARRNADYAKAYQWNARKLLHQPDRPTEGFLDDYAAWALALTALYQATGDPDRLRFAQELVDRALQVFENPASPLLFYTSQEAETLLARKTEMHDSVIPSANTMMTQALHILASLAYEDRYRQQANAMLSAMADGLAHLRYTAGWGWLALQQSPATAEVAIVGPDSYLWAGQLDAAPFKSLVLAFAAEPAEYPQMLAGKRPPANQTAAWLCVEGACLPAVFSLDGLLNLLAERGYAAVTASAGT